VGAQDCLSESLRRPFIDDDASARVLQNSSDRLDVGGNNYLSESDVLKELVWDGVVRMLVNDVRDDGNL
jgi:hypothetical protein